MRFSMDKIQPLPLLGGLSPQQFMKRHWQKKPLLVRGAVPGLEPLLSRSELFALAARDEVESRLVARSAGQWRFRRGPFGRRSLPPLSQRAWTLLLQGVDLHDERAHALLAQFRFVTDARLDDLMISYATDGGGVGPHCDSYDVFLLQSQGRRRWRIGRQKDLSLLADVPLKILAAFEAEAEYILEPGDLLYLPPCYAHEGVALGECQTCSIGFRAPARGELARELLQRLCDDDTGSDDALYRDPAEPATENPGAVPASLQRFARDAVRDAFGDGKALDRALGEYLTEPKPSVWFEGAALGLSPGGTALEIVLDRRTRMMYDKQHVFINGESYRASGRDAALMRALADRRRLGPAQLRHASAAARSLIGSWCEAGWLQGREDKE